MARTKKAAAKKKPARIGRPPIDNPADLRINVRVTEEQRLRYQAAADAKGMGFATWMRQLMDRAAPPPKD